MKVKSWFVGAGITLLFAGLPLPAFSQTVVKVGGEDYPVVNELPIIINRNELGNPIINYTWKSADRRYRVVEILPTLTQEVQVSNPPAARNLYRLADVYDKQERKKMTVALPIQFEPAK
ncbi:hypothetical protein [Microcoleus sp. FACHB-672]|uniref:hypothetical protein n=1 Tax=Microcoleus sp. FACHB-672 TaxID=2692825 RepID=UPI001682E883|nr:hypothetical protein [Microcoleus sp. FACHB-672]MBD2039682.1 hypothetical protein [Microcoleus sp. FACHB-672]